MRRISIALAAGALALATALTGCSSSSSESTTETSATPGQVLPPVIVTEDATTAEAKVGDTVVFNVPDPETSTISVDDPTILEVEQGRTEGSAYFNPGAKALKKGKATVTLEVEGAPTRTIEVTVS